MRRVRCCVPAPPRVEMTPRAHSGGRDPESTKHQTHSRPECLQPDETLLCRVCVRRLGQLARPNRPALAPHSPTARKMYPLPEPNRRGISQNGIMRYPGCPVGTSLASPTCALWRLPPRPGSRLLEEGVKGLCWPAAWGHHPAGTCTWGMRAPARESRGAEWEPGRDCNPGFPPRLGSSAPWLGGISPARYTAKRAALPAWAWPPTVQNRSGQSELFRQR